MKTGRLSLLTKAVRSNRLFPEEHCLASTLQLDFVSDPFVSVTFNRLNPTSYYTAGIIGKIVEAVYAIRPASSRYSESKFCESLLDKWYIELPEHLRFDPGSYRRPVPPPHVLTLHMKYWSSVLLLHRPL